mmetsp:Transcript_51313/g.148141  ORF Transcript_51313/g.148141 Transcript_51313/m.148141 type:complete len:215 (+) Transcript_51313:94-738(+)
MPTVPTSSGDVTQEVDDVEAFLPCLQQAVLLQRHARQPCVEGVLVFDLVEDHLLVPGVGRAHVLHAHALQLVHVRGEARLAHELHGLGHAERERHVQLRDAPCPLKEPEIFVHCDDLAEAGAQSAQVLDHVVELVHLAQSALPIRSHWQGVTVELRHATWASRVKLPCDRVDVLVEDPVANAGMLVDGEGAYPVGLVELVFPIQLALQSGKLRT